MALSRVKTWIAGETLTASDLNAEFANILDNAVSLISPLTAALDADGNILTLDSDGDTSITADTDDQIDYALSGTDLFRMDGTATTPVNGLTFIARATGSKPSVQALTSDANEGLDIRDDNGNEILVLSSVASAVNEITITAAAAASEPSIAATGDDTDIDITLTPKGAGNVNISSGTLQIGGSTFTVDGTQIVIGSDASGDILYHNGSAYTRLAKGTDGQNLTLSSGLPAWTTSALTNIDSIELIRKTLNETVNSSTTLQDDDDFQFSIAGSGSYYFEAHLIVNSGATPDIKFAFNHSAGGLGLSWAVRGSAEAIDEVSAFGTAYAITTNGNNQRVHITGHYRSSGAGTFKLQWAQNTSDAGNTTVLGNSYMILWKSGT